MKDKYIALLAEVDRKPIDSYRSETFADIPASGAIFFAIVGGCSMAASALSEETGLPLEQVERIMANLFSAGYIRDDKIRLNIPALTEENVLKEYNLFTMAGGTGVITKV